MKFSIMELRKETFDGAVSFDESVNVSELETLNNDIREIGSVRVKGICTMDKDEFVFSFTIKGNDFTMCTYFS